MALALPIEYVEVVVELLPHLANLAAISFQILHDLDLLIALLDEALAHNSLVDGVSLLQGRVPAITLRDQRKKLTLLVRQAQLL